MPDDTIEARARRAAEEVIKCKYDWTIITPFVEDSEGNTLMNTVEYDVKKIAAIIVREMGEEFDKIKRDRDCMTAIHMCLEGNEAVSRVLNGCYYTKEGTK